MRLAEGTTPCRKHVSGGRGVLRGLFREGAGPLPIGPEEEVRQGRAVESIRFKPDPLQVSTKAVRKLGERFRTPILHILPGASRLRSRLAGPR